MKTNQIQPAAEKNSKAPQHDASASNTEKDPSTWTTGGEPMTGAQHSYLTTLSEEAGVKVKEDLTKAEASQKIDELRKNNPRAQAAK